MVLDKVLQGFELGPLGSLLGSPDQRTGSSGGGQILKDSLTKVRGPNLVKVLPPPKIFTKFFTTFVTMFLLRFYYVFTRLQCRNPAPGGPKKGPKSSPTL